MTQILAAIAFAATFNGCPITHMTYSPPLIIQSCTVYVSAHPGLATYRDGAVVVPGGVLVDRVFANGMEN